jgi:hypothetical protein
VRTCVKFQHIYKSQLSHSDIFITCMETLSIILRPKLLTQCCRLANDSYTGVYGARGKRFGASCTVHLMQTTRMLTIYRFKLLVVAFASFDMPKIDPKLSTHVFCEAIFFNPFLPNITYIMLTLVHMPMCAKCDLYATDFQ